ncbi:MAG: TCP-1/cpn60 chaperonin family protein, partial [Nanoarchaeota archaeon]
VPLLACKAPGFGDTRLEQLTDLAILTGGKVISNSAGLELEKVTLEDLGQVDNVIANKYHTTFIGGKGKKELINARIKFMQATIANLQDDYQKEKLSERLAKLTSGVAVIKVGASTEVELKEKKMRVEDSLCAARASMEEGIIPGGGIALMRASKFLQGINDSGELEIARKILINVLKEPIKQIAYNSGLDGNEIIAQINLNNGNFWYGYNFLTDKYGDLKDQGVIDPFKVVRLTLENSASIAGMLLTTEVIINKEEELEIARMPKSRSE